MKSKKVFSLSAIFVILVILDQISKYLAAEYLIHKPIEIIPKVFELKYLENPGAAWGILSGQILFFLLITVIIMSAVIYIMYRLECTKIKRYKFAQIVLTVLLSGAFGNLIDRCINGYVIDYFYFKLIDFPIFNVADCYVTISVAIILIMILFVFKEDELDTLFSNKRREEDLN